MALKIKKVLNNNVAVIMPEIGLETVVMGTGIAFKKKAGDLILEEKIDKTFTLMGKETNSKFQELITEMPMEYILVAEKIISYAKDVMKKEVADSIYITLTDHISIAVNRYKEGNPLRNAFLWDIKQFYPNEFSIGSEAIHIVKADLGIEFLEDEAAFMALHFVNAQLNEDMTLVYNMTKFIQEVTNIIKAHFQIEYNGQALSQYRLVNHLKFFSQRLFQNTTYEDNADASMLEVLKDRYEQEYQCAMDIAKFVKEKYHHQMSDEEILYITVHLTRVIKEARNSQNE
jgi:Transcriptional antiterminator